MALRVRIAMAVMAVFSACSRPPETGAPTKAEAGPSPVTAQATRPPRVWEAASDVSRVATGRLTVFETHFPPAVRPDTGQAVGAAVTTSVFIAEGGQMLTTVAAGGADGAAMVLDDAQGRVALASLLSVPADAALDLYRVIDEGGADKPRLCGKAPAAFLVVWRLPGASDMKLAPVAGGAPGATGATVCAVLDYRAAGAR